jgi:DNA repair photolyase
VILSSITDPYQPLKRPTASRVPSRVLADHKFPVQILTKSPWCFGISACSNVQGYWVGITINEENDSAAGV